MADQLPLSTHPRPELLEILQKDVPAAGEYFLQPLYPVVVVGVLTDPAPSKFSEKSVVCARLSDMPEKSNREIKKA